MKLHFSVFISKVGAKPRFEKEAGGGSEMPSFNLNFVHCSQNNELIILIFFSSQSKSPELGTFCGSKIPSLIRSSGNSLYLTLTSDDGDTGKGFQAIWRAVSNDIRKYKFQERVGFR